MISETSYFALLAGWEILGAFVFVLLFRVTAPYGRHAAGVQWKILGPAVDSQVAWIVQEGAAIVWATMFLITGSHLSMYSILFFLLYVAHYVNRAIIYPLQMLKSPSQGKHKKNVFLLTVLCAIFFNLCNTFFLFYPLFNFSVKYSYPPMYLTSPRFLIGIALMGLGFWLNHYHDSLLSIIRERAMKSTPEGQSYYRIPHGGLFEYVSAPNYLCELIEWIGFAIMVQTSGAWSFVLWVVANLGPRAISHHKWYKKTFEAYPKSRTALIPFVL